MQTIAMIFLLGLIHVSLASAEEIDKLGWKLKSESGNIQVFHANVPGSDHKAVLAVTVINADIDSVVSILRTPATCAKWVYRCSVSYLYKQTSEMTDIVYTKSKMPFPLKNRDILAKIAWTQNPESKTVTGVGVAMNNALPTSKNHIRIKHAKTIWELTPLPTGKTKVRSYAHVDPAGGLPSWLTNQLSTNIPIETLTGLKKLLATL